MAAVRRFHAFGVVVMPHKGAIHSFMLIGEERDGGYTYLFSKDLPGFTFMLEPGEVELSRLSLMSSSRLLGLI